MEKRIEPIEMKPNVYFISCEFLCNFEVVFLNFEESIILENCERINREPE